MTWAMEQQIVRDASARHVLLCLANYADHQGKAAFPSASTLVNDTGLSERTVRAKLDFLEQSGLIVKGNQAIVAAYIDRADKRPVCYDLHISRGAAVAGRSERGANDDATGCNSRSNGVQMTQERGAAVAPNTSPNPSSNPSLKVEARASRLPADWKPSESDVAFCREERPDLLPTQVADQFRDYWIAQPGAKGRKVDWPATWRNWVRNQRAANQPRQIRSYHDDRADTIAALTGRNRGYEHDDRTIELPAFRLVAG